MSRKLLRNPEVMWRDEPGAREKSLADEGNGDREIPCLTLVHLGNMHQLNLVGAEVWKLCDGSLGIEEIIDEVLSRFDAGREEIAGDVNAFVDDLLEQGLLVKA